MPFRCFFCKIFLQYTLESSLDFISFFHLRKFTPIHLFGTTYSEVPIIRTGTYASSAAHAMYCQTGPTYDTYNRHFRVGVSKKSKIMLK